MNKLNNDIFWYTNNTLWINNNWILYNKLLLTNTITNNDINISAAISYNKLNINNGDITFNKLELLNNNIIVCTDVTGKITSTNIIPWTVIQWNGNIMMENNFNMNWNKIINLWNPTNANDWVNKLYVDNKFNVDKYYKIIVGNLASDVVNNPPLTPSLGVSYIVGTSPTGAWTGKTGYLVYYDGTSWIDIYTIITNWMMFGICLEVWEIPSGSFNGKKNNIIKYNGVNYDFIIPQYNDVSIISNIINIEWGKIYAYEGLNWKLIWKINTTYLTFIDNELWLNNNSITYDKLNLWNNIIPFNKLNALSINNIATTDNNGIITTYNINPNNILLNNGTVSMIWNLNLNNNKIIN